MGQRLRVALDRSQARRPVAIGAFAVALATALWHFPSAFLDVSRETGALEAQSALERELVGARRVDVDTRVLVEARRFMPEDATYAVVTGPNVRVSGPATLPAVAPFAGYWLLPRRRLPYVTPAADWVLSYGGDLRTLEVEYARVVHVAPGIALAEVRR